MNRSNVITFKRLKAVILALSLMMISFVSTADSSFDDAVSRQEIRLNVTVNNSDVVTREHLKLQVEVLSLYPFSEKVALPYFDIQDAVVVKSNQPISSSTRMINKQKWYSQKSQISLFPTSAKTLLIPSIELSPVVTMPNGHTTTGVITSAPTEITVQDSTNPVDSKLSVVGKDAELALTTDRKIDEDMKIGDAVTFTYTLKVSDSNTMVLPTIKLNDIDGTEIYRKPAEKEDILDPLSKTNTAQFKQSFTVIVQKEGAYSIPAIEIPWWDTKTHTLKHLTVKEQRLTVGNDSLGALKSSNHFDFMGKLSHLTSSYRSALLKLLGLMVLLVWFSVTTRLPTKLISKFQQYLVARRREKAFLESIKTNQYLDAVKLIYHTFDNLYEGHDEALIQLDQQSMNTWKKLLKAQYSKNDGLIINQEDAKALYKNLMKPHKRKIESSDFSWGLNNHC